MDVGRLTLAGQGRGSAEAAVQPAVDRQSANGEDSHRRRRESGGRGPSGGADDDDKPDAYQALLDASTRAGPGGVAKRDLHKICKPYRRLGTEERGKLLDSMIADRVLYTVPTLSGRGLNYVASRFIQESAQ